MIIETIILGQETEACAAYRSLIFFTYGWINIVNVTSNIEQRRPCKRIAHSHQHGMLIADLVLACCSVYLTNHIQINVMSNNVQKAYYFFVLQLQVETFVPQGSFCVILSLLVKVLLLLGTLKWSINQGLVNRWQLLPASLP